MEFDPEEQKSGMRWLVVVGLIAIAVSFTLKTADDRLSTSKREERLEQTLKELRTAQLSLPARVTDERQTQTYLSE